MEDETRQDRWGGVKKGLDKYDKIRLVGWGKKYKTSQVGVG